MQFTTRQIARSAVVGAVYAVLTLALAPLSYGPIQFRIAEALCVLPFFFPHTAWGLFAGCAMANIISAYGVLDVVCGSLATLLACLWTARIGIRSGGSASAKALACLPPVLLNGIVIGAVIAWTATPEAFWTGALTFGLQVALGEAVVLYALGLPLLCYLPALPVFRHLQSGR